MKGILKGIMFVSAFLLMSCGKGVTDTVLIRVNDSAETMEVHLDAGKKTTVDIGDVHIVFEPNGNELKGTVVRGNGGTMSFSVASDNSTKALTICGDSVTLVASSSNQASFSSCNDG